MNRIRARKQNQEGTETEGEKTRGKLKEGRGGKDKKSKRRRGRFGDPPSDKQFNHLWHFLLIING